MIAGLGQACSLISQNLGTYNAHMKKMKIYLERQLKVSAFLFIIYILIIPENLFRKTTKGI